MKRWEISRVREEYGEQIHTLAASLGVVDLCAAVLYGRGMQTKESAEAFLAGENAAFYDPFLLKDMDAAVAAVRAAVAEHKKIVIYGDYDVDGVTAVCVLYLYLCKLGARVEYYIPDRGEEGYGVSREAIDRLHEAEVQLVITVDTGITAIDEIEYARGLGMDFVVTDHHTCRPVLPQALAVVNPHRPDCTYPFPELAGVGVAFKLVCAIEQQIAWERGEQDAGYLRRVCEQCVDLAAIGTIADVMPLTDENRLIVSLGLSMLAHTERPGIAALLAEEGDEKRTINTALIGFRIAPRLNAAGRLDHASRAVELFLCEDEQSAFRIAAELCELNRERQRMVSAIEEQAQEMIAREGMEKDGILVLANEGWHSGVIGIVATRLIERYGRPAILLSLDGDLAKGSGRSVSGINLVNALAENGDLLEKFGGHELAAGLTVRRENLGALREALNAYVREHRACVSEDVLLIDCTVNSNELTVPAADQLARLEPYGSGNPEPVLALLGARIVSAAPIGEARHTRFVLEKDGIQSGAVYFGCRLSHTNFCAGDTVDAAFRLQVNAFRGVRTAQLVLSDLRLSGQSGQELCSLREQYEQSKAAGSARERVIPDRGDFAALYRYISAQVRALHDVIGVRQMVRALGGMNYAKVRYMIEIFREMQLFSVQNIGTEPDVFAFRMLNTGKVNLEDSEIFQTLKNGNEMKV